MILFCFVDDSKVFLRLLGANLKKTRIEKGISQQDLAYNSDIAKSTIQRIEKGELNPTILVLKKISKGLDIDLCNWIE